MTQKKTYHFIAHTHWDREWYMTFEQFRYRLVQLIDKLLDLLERDPEFKSFHLDGQTIVLEDYYALRPHQKPRLERLIREGRILIGPWYQQNDLYLTSAESTIRSLMEGIGASRRLGGEMKIGYLPDHFGLTGQMPQLFRDVGIDNCVFGRAYDAGKHGSPFFRWQSPDGSEVTALQLYYWYNSAQRLPGDPDQLQAVFDMISEREENINPTSHYPMMNGVDHLEAQENLPEVLQQLRSIYGDEIDVLHSTLPDYVKSVQREMEEQPAGTYPVLQGELREAPEYNILAGTLSSRIYIKQANVEGHDLIEKWLEPLSTWCAMLDLDPYDKEGIRYVWKLYMQNHPHDSICGCSQDAVHDEMMDRHRRVKELTETIIGRKLGIIARQVDSSGYERDDQKLLVVNTSQLEAAEVIRTPVYFLDDEKVESFSIEDENGQPLPYRLVSEAPSRVQVISPINLPGVIGVKRCDIEWQPRVPALGYAAYRVRQHREGVRLQDAGNPETSIMENERLRVELQDNGMFHVLHKKSGRRLSNQGQIQNVGDRGDLYVFKAVQDGEGDRIWDGAVEWVSRTDNALYQEAVYRFVWELPIGLDASKERMSEETAANVFEVTLRLDAASERLNIQVQVDNGVKDHRLRMLFPSADEALHVLAGGQLDVVKRSWDSGKAWERDANSQPFWKWFAPVYNSGGSAIFAKGLHDYEMLDEGRTAGVTLLRGVETIHLRESVYMEQDYQPKAQCIGRHTLELALRPFAEESATLLYQESELYHQSLRTKLLPIDEDKWNKGRSWVQDTSHGGLFKLPDPNASKSRLPLKDSLVEVEGDVMLSAQKWSEEGNQPIIRLYNVESRSSDVALSVAVPINGAMIANIIEEQQGTVDALDNRITCSIAAKKFVTYKLV
ncbi:alpha-mannosidase [Paenibacillus agaridevorans]|uniref:alpha-mannosidase n=1 Tax=Paenibacillus agaridevorans TaxID=171404 RepID=UPI001BE4BBA4|nr:glycoside hydrolase family 38 C-terminal domain-containing protein [Paenibacillus agaridevorans]